MAYTPLYDDVLGLVGIKTPEGNKWRFYTPSWVPPRTGGWYWNGKQTSSSENSLFYPVSLYYKEKTIGDILTEERSDDGFSHGTFLFYFGPPPPDGQDYPEGALSYNKIQRHKNKEVRILHFVGSKQPFWREITLRPEDVDAEPEPPFIWDHEDHHYITGIELDNLIWLFDTKRGWGLYVKTDDDKEKIEFILPSDEQNNYYSEFWPGEVTWIPKYNTPLIHNEAAFRKAYSDIDLEENRRCYFYFGNPDKDGGDYPAGKLNEKELADIETNNTPVLKMIRTREEPYLKWVLITPRPEDRIRPPLPRAVAALRGFGPARPIFPKRGGTRSKQQRKRYPKRRQTLRRTRR